MTMQFPAHYWATTSCTYCGTHLALCETLNRAWALPRKKTALTHQPAARVLLFLLTPTPNSAGQYCILIHKL